MFITYCWSCPLHKGFMQSEDLFILQTHSELLTFVTQNVYQCHESQEQQRLLLFKYSPVSKCSLQYRSHSRCCSSFTHRVPTLPVSHRFFQPALQQRRVERKPLIFSCSLGEGRARWDQKQHPRPSPVSRAFGPPAFNLI